jgi:glutathione S-transferase
MKLYMNPVSMTSRPVRLFIAESDIDVDEQVVDVMAGEHYQEPFASINPNRLVPVLELAQGQRGAVWLRRSGQGPEVRRDLMPPDGPIVGGGHCAS